MTNENQPISDAEIKAAESLVFAVAAFGDRHWKMSIPPQPMDSDELLMRIIARCDFLEKQLAKNQR